MNLTARSTDQPNRVFLWTGQKPQSSLRMKRCVLRNVEIYFSELTEVSGKTEHELLKRIDHQFGIRPDASHTMLPPMPDKEPEDCDLVPPALSNSEEIANPDPSPYNTSGYPNWMYDELVGIGKPDTGLHAGWNPIQTILHAYGDNYFSGGLNNDYDQLTQHMSYDSMDTTSADGCSYPNSAPLAWDGFQ